MRDPAGPPLAVRRDFGCETYEPRRLSGGQGTAWAVGEVILKPTADPGTDGWIAQTTAALQPNAYRLPRPVPSSNGQWTTAGWCAWRRITGEHGSGGRWREIVAVARALHEDLATVPRPAFLERRQDPWAISDRVAWGLPYIPRHELLDQLLQRCARWRRPERQDDQLVHGDLYGNVLFAPDELPAVIDLSPYWRPAAYALAIAAVDAIAWYSASAAVIDDLEDLDDLASLLARAAMFRLVTADIMATPDRLAQEPSYVTHTAAEFSPLVELIERCATGSPPALGDI